MTRCGYAALIGRPNVGKSTLLNRMLGEKVAITSRKPQTTRHQLVGIHTDGEVQTLFVDTPGLHRAEKRALNRYMNRTANAAVRDVDVAVMLVDRTAWNHNDELAFEALERCPNHKIVVINKVDLLKDKATMLPVISSLAERCPGLEVVPVSALGRTTGRRSYPVDPIAYAGEPLLLSGRSTDGSQRTFPCFGDDSREADAAPWPGIAI
jgi:GTP-binding protein Era